MIHHLDSTLEAMLKHEEFGLNDSELRKEVTISFEPPDEKFSPEALTINLFLYDVRERKELRGTGEDFWKNMQGDSTKWEKFHSLWLDCSYLITVWTGTGSSNVPKEHRLLTEIMLTLARNEEIPKDVLQGGLAGDNPSAVLFETKTLPVKPPEAIQTLGSRLKAAINYMVTMGVYVREEKVFGKPIEERVFKAVKKGDETNPVEQLVFKEKDKFPQR